MEEDRKREEACKGVKEVLSAGKEYYEIRLESIGGLGANLCGKLLGELGLRYLGVNSSNFSSYGSEKTGTPVKGFIRYCRADKEIHVHSPIEEPDLLVIFHQALLMDESVWKGCGADSAVIIALESENDRSLQQLKDKTDRGSYGIKGRFIYGVEAQRIAMETRSRINVVMLGAMLRVMDIGVEAGEQICRDTLGKKYPDALSSNIEGLKRGYAEIRLIAADTESEPAVNEQAENGKKTSDHSKEEKKAAQGVWGYENAPLGGINPHLGNSVVSDLSPSRQGYIPIFIKEKCIQCGLCHSTCPDMVFQFQKGKYKGREMMINQGLDYYHCKGCLRCVDVCPVQALVGGIEAEHPEKQYFMPNQALLRTPDYYEKTGADGYITGEAYLTEKRVEGGEV